MAHRITVTDFMDYHFPFQNSRLRVLRETIPHKNELLNSKLEPEPTVMPLLLGACVCFSKFGNAIGDRIDGNNSEYVLLTTTPLTRDVGCFYDEYLLIGIYGG